MKSALFESLNDRSNITNAYLKMLNESAHNVAESTFDEKDLIEVSIPDWAVTYIEYSDDSGLTDEDKAMVDKYIENITNDGYRLVLDGENLGFKAFPEFGDAADCIKYYLIDNTSQSNESVDDDADDITDVEDIAGELVGYLYSKYPKAAFIGEKTDSNGDIILKYDFSRSNMDVIKNDIAKKFGEEKVSFGSGRTEFAPEVGFTVLVVHKPNMVGESDGGKGDDETEDSAWFSSQGELVKTIPQECVDACTKPGVDAYDACSYWVDELGFDKGLDIAQAKGFLQSTGGWERKEIAAMDPKEVAIRILWIACGDLKDNFDSFYIGDAEPFDESCDESSASNGKRKKVVVTRIEWDDEGVMNGLPEKCSLEIEVENDDEINDKVSAELSERFKAVPKGFNIAKVVEIDSDVNAANEIVDQKELDKLTKKYDVINEKR